jgi:hypothetical protein
MPKAIPYQRVRFGMILVPDLIVNCGNPRVYLLVADVSYDQIATDRAGMAAVPAAASGTERQVRPRNVSK